MIKPIIVAVILIGVALLGFFVIWPNFQEMNSLKVQVEQKEAELLSLKEYYAKISKIYEDISAEPEVLAKINSAIPDSPSIPDLFYFIQKKASENGAVFSEIGGASTVLFQKEKNIKATSFVLSFSSPYESLKNFVSQIEKSDRIIELEKIDFSRKTEGSDSPEGGRDIFNFDITIKTYSY